jgi:hypothetical protein
MSTIERIEDAIFQYGDIQYKGDGRWLCHDTGVEYSSADVRSMLKPAKEAPKPLSSKAQAARASAKNLGMKALTGTARQKEWAEKIRSEKLLDVYSMKDQAREDAIEAVSRLKKASFWIDNRAKTGREIIAVAVASLHAERKYNELAEDLNLFIMLEEQKLGNFGTSFWTGRWPEEARKRENEIREEMRQTICKVIWR